MVTGTEQTTSPRIEHWEKLAERVAIGSGLACIVIPGLIVAAWMTNNAWFATMHHDLILMTLKSGVSIFLSGSALLLLAAGRSGQPSRRGIVAALPVAVSLLLCLHTIIIVVGSVLFPAAIKAPEVTQHFQPPISAALLLVVNMAILILVVNSYRRTTSLTSLIGMVSIVNMLAGWVVLISFWYGLPYSFSDQANVPSLTTIICFILLNLAVFAVEGWRAEWFRPYLGNSVLAQLIWSILPPVLVLVMFEGWTDSHNSSGPMNEPVGHTLFSSLLAIFIVYIVLRTAIHLNSSLVTAENDLGESNSRLLEMNNRLQLSNDHLNRIWKELLERNLLFNQLADNINEIFWLYEIATAQFIYVNKAFEELWGWPVTAAFDFDRLMPHHIVGEDRYLWLDIIGRLQQSSPDSLNLEFRIRQPCGSLRWIRTRLSSVDKVASGNARIAAVSSDITAFKDAAHKEKIHQEQLLQADKMASLGVLISGIVHEINNPNNYILPNARFVSRIWQDADRALLESLGDGGDVQLAGLSFREERAEIAEMIKSIASGAQRIDSIVKNLRAYSRPGTAELNSIVNLNEVVVSAIAILNAMLHQSSVNHHVALAPDLPAVRGNAQQLEQVVINLLSNACQSLEKGGGLITIETHAISEDNQIGLVITDNGCGIRPEHMKEIFDPFFTTKRESGGTGLGLSISYNIVTAHRGKLAYDSKPGFGTKVSMMLPVS